MADRGLQGPTSALLAEARRVIETHFPGIWSSVEVCLSVVATLLLKDPVDVATVVLVGPSASSKTLVLAFLDRGHWLFYVSDKFSPKAFVSHYAGATAQSLATVDLLPKIQWSALVTPEMAPVFRGRRDELMEVMAIITRVLDGQGLMTDSGVHGRRGYQGDYYFVWLAATTPLPDAAWEVMGQVGSRFMLLPVGGDGPSDDDLFGALRDEIGIRARVEECRAAVTAVVNQLFPNRAVLRQINWDRTATRDEYVRALAELARLLSCLRGVVPTIGRERGNAPVYGVPLIEQPYRAAQVLFNVARGHALLYGREHLTDADIALVVPLALGTCPEPRRRLIEALLEHRAISAADAEGALGVSRETARRYLHEMEALGIVTSRYLQQSEMFTLDPRFKWFMSDEFKTLRNTKPWEEVSL